MGAQGVIGRYKGMRIDDLLKQPGFYEFVERFVDNPDGTIDTEVYGIEVEQDGTCHQLTPQGERDGVLPREGWNRSVLFVRQVAKPDGSAS